MGCCDKEGTGNNCCKVSRFAIILVVLLAGVAIGYGIGKCATACKLKQSIVQAVTPAEVVKP